ncbi:MAG: hypothetical protein Q8W44_13290 [Candidatus Palauibacterales bacterium]|nr:hypothetical protein [Candidatus Palauibacterales bacterium]
MAERITVEDVMEARREIRDELLPAVRDAELEVVAEYFWALDPDAPQVEGHYTVDELVGILEGERPWPADSHLRGLLNQYLQRRDANPYLDEWDRQGEVRDGLPELLERAAA